MDTNHAELAVRQTTDTLPNIPFSFLTDSKNHRETMKKLFPKMSASDFMLMWLVAGKMHVSGTEKVYLMDIAETLNLPIHQVSNIVKQLKSKGLVIWKHDGDGDRGTYIQLTESSLNAIQEQHEILHTFYQTVIEQYGEDEFIQLMRDLSRLEDVITDTLNGEDCTPEDEDV